jgi:antitoxin PrlF
MSFITKTRLILAKACGRRAPLRYGNTDKPIGITMPRITSKGQVTIPKRIRDHLGLKPGSEVEFAFGADGEVVLKTKREPLKEPIESRLAKIRGTLDLGMTTDEFMRFLRGDPDDDPR